MSCSKQELSLSELPTPVPGLAPLTDEYPEVVKLNGCTGTVISPNIVLTAGHCVKSGRRFSVTTPSGIFSTSRSKLLGPGTQGDAHDLGALIFASAIFESDPMPLGKSVLLGNTLFLVGYGCGGME